VDEAQLFFCVLL